MMARRTLDHRIPARMAVEGEEGHPPAVERGQTGNEHADNESEIADSVLGPGRKGGMNDGVLGIKAREAPFDPWNAQAGNGDRANRHHRVGHGQELGQIAVTPHVLLMVHAVDNRTGTQEQQGLKEGVREEVEHRCLIGTYATGEEHVAQLRTGRIGDDPLNVVLGQTDGCREQGRDRTNNSDNGLGLGGVFEHRRQQAKHIDAGGHHGCSVDQR